MTRLLVALLAFIGGLVAFPHDGPTVQATQDFPTRPLDRHAVSRSERRPSLPAASKPPRSSAKARHDPSPLGERDLRGWQRWMQVTAYCATGNRTASGQWPAIGDAATLDRSIPFGTRIFVAGVGVLTVTDRIGSGSQIDIFMGSGPTCTARALRWGRHFLLVRQVHS